MPGNRYLLYANAGPGQARFWPSHAHSYSAFISGGHIPAATPTLAPTTLLAGRKSWGRPGPGCGMHRNQNMQIPSHWRGVSPTPNPGGWGESSRSQIQKLFLGDTRHGSHLWQSPSCSLNLCSQVPFSTTNTTALSQVLWESPEDAGTFQTYMRPFPSWCGEAL